MRRLGLPFSKFDTHTAIETSDVLQRVHFRAALRIGVFLSMIMSMCSQAQPLPDTTRGYLSKEIEISEDRFSDILFRSAPVQRVTEKDFLTFNSLQVSDIVGSFRGVILRDYGGVGGLKTISVRGLNANHTTVLWDGLPVHDAQTGQLDLSRISLQHLESISLLQGNEGDWRLPASSYNGSSLLILSTKGIASQKKDLTVGGVYGSFGERRVSGSLFSPLDSLSRIIFSSEWIYANGEFPYRFQDGREERRFTRRNTDLTSGRMELDYQYRFATQTSSAESQSLLHLKGFWYYSDRGLPGPFILGNEENSLQRLLLHDFFLQGRFESSFSPLFPFAVSFKGSGNRLSFSDPALPVQGGFEDTYQRYSGYGAFNTRYEGIGLGDGIVLSMDGSIDAGSTILTTSIPGFSEIRRNESAAATAFHLHSSRIHLDGTLSLLWIEDVRESNSLFSIKESRSDAGILPGLYISLSPFDRSEGTSAFGVEQDLEWDFFLVGSLRRSLRLPTLNERYYTRVGNPDLSPELSWHGNVGLRWGIMGGSTLRLEIVSDVFLIDTENQIIAIPRDAFNWSIQNVAMSRSFGVEWGARVTWKPTERIISEFGFNYSYLDARDRTPSSPTKGGRLPYIAPESMVMSMVIHVGSLSFTQCGTYISYRFDLAENTIQSYLPPYFLWDIGLSGEYDAGSFRLRLRGEVNNLLGADYVVIRSFPMPGRNGRIRLDIFFN